MRLPYDEKYVGVGEKRSATENDLYLPYCGGVAAPSGDWKRRVGGVKMQIAIPANVVLCIRRCSFRMNRILHEKTRECGHVKWEKSVLVWVQLPTAASVWFWFSSVCGFTFFLLSCQLCKELKPPVYLRPHSPARGAVLLWCFNDSAYRKRD